MAAAEDFVDDNGPVSRRPIGRIFVEKGIVTQDQLDKALAKQEGTNARLGEVLVDLGFIDRLDLASALSRQWAGADTPAEDEPAASLPVAPAEQPEATRNELDDLRAERDQLRSAAAQAAAAQEELRVRLAAVTADFDAVSAELDVQRRSVDAEAAAPSTAERHFLRVPNGTGYSLLERNGLAPEIGEAVELRYADGSVQGFVVAKVAPTPFPESVSYAYLEPRETRADLL